MCFSVSYLRHLTIPYGSKLTYTPPDTRCEFYRDQTVPYVWYSKRKYFVLSGLPREKPALLCRAYRIRKGNIFVCFVGPRGFDLRERTGLLCQCLARHSCVSTESCEMSLWGFVSVNIPDTTQIRSAVKLSRSHPETPKVCFTSTLASLAATPETCRA